MTKVSILMPVYNEAPTVEEAVQRVLDTDFPFDWELIMVDDGSTDGTSELLPVLVERSNRITLLAHERNKGKGTAIRTAVAAAAGEFSTILDADLEYDPTDIPALIAPLEEGRSNVAFGVRAFDGYSSHSYLYVLGNRGVTLAANVVFNVYLKDVITCHKAMRTDLFRALPLQEPGFAVEPEIAARVIQRGERIFEVPVSYIARATAEGKKLTALDGFRALRTLVRCRLSPRA